MKGFNLIEIDDRMLPAQKSSAMRVNALGSLYYFIKIVLRRRKLTEALHRPVCELLEDEWIKLLLEMPRDHLKSTICSEGYPIWRALPFSQYDEDCFAKLGYDDEFIRKLHRFHNQDIRICLVSENQPNAIMLGKRVNDHFTSNSLYMALFPESLPNSSCVWSNLSMQVQRTQNGLGHGEGTFDFLGVGNALQSRHYNMVIQDDLVGRKAVESITVMDKTIDYHRLVVGAFESEDETHDNPELVVGNRWTYHDVNSWIRENEPWFKVVSHSALGGCCALHPADSPIFPEFCNFDKLMRFKARLGPYSFSCQFLNNPTAPEDADFKPEWLKYFEENVQGEANPQRFAKYLYKENNRLVVDDLEKPLAYGNMQVCLVSDPAHAGNSSRGRCRHSIVVVGRATVEKVERYFLLDCWAQSGPYDKYIKQLWELARKWRLHRVGLETVAAQKYLAHHIENMNEQTDWYLKIDPLEGEVEGPDGEITRKKEWRIRNILEPIFADGRFYTQDKFQDFHGEYVTFPKGKYVDILDALAYAPQVLRNSFSAEKHTAWTAYNRKQARNFNRAYAQ